ncbi:MAG: alpha/beta fold hydrolase BchO [Pseudomonadota bacterium]
MDWASARGWWPHAASSRFVTSGGATWHIQQMGDGPDLLLIHGAGGATQSWRNLMPILARHYHCTAMDLPGQGLSKQLPSRKSDLDTLAKAVAALALDLKLSPKAIVAHSAGTPIALRMAELGTAPPIFAINAALSKFDGVAGWLFPLAAKMLAALPFSADVFARVGGQPANVRRLLVNTGSAITDQGLYLYGKLAANPDHVGGTLRMMADWTLDGLLTRLPNNPSETLFIVGDKDGTVPPDVSKRAARRMPNAQMHHFENLGHLAHEEAADEVARVILTHLNQKKPRH